MKSNEPTPNVSGRLRAIIVDDEPTARRGVRLLLERDGGVEVVGEASTGIEAAELMRREKPDLAFLDVQMPGSDGFEALAEIEPVARPECIPVPGNCRAPLWLQRHKQNCDTRRWRPASKEYRPEPRNSRRHD